MNFKFEFRSGWVRLGVVRLFIEHTCPPGVQNHPSDEQNAFKLWKVRFSLLTSDNFCV